MLYTVCTIDPPLPFQRWLKPVTIEEGHGDNNRSRDCGFDNDLLKMYSTYLGRRYVSITGFKEGLRSPTVLQYSYSFDVPLPDRKNDGICLPSLPPDCLEMP